MTIHPPIIIRANDTTRKVVRDVLDVTQRLVVEVKERPHTRDMLPRVKVRAKAKERLAVPLRREDADNLGIWTKSREYAKKLMSN
jgi:hypothetical protein